MASLIDTLGLNPGMSTYFAHAPAEYFVEIGAHYRTRHPDEDGMYEFIHAFFTEREQLIASAPILVSKLADDGILWISWPYHTSMDVSQIDEKTVLDTLSSLGLNSGKSRRILSTWQAINFSF